MSFNYALYYFKDQIKETENIFQRNPFIEQKKYFALDKFFLWVEQIKTIKKVKEIIFIIDDESFRGYPGQIEQIYKIMEELKNNGKKLIFYAKTYNSKELLLSSICDERIMHPEGFLSYLGFKAEFTFYKKLMDRLNIKADVYRRGKYKGAADPFRVDKIDEAQEEAYSLLIKRFSEIVKENIVKNLNKKPEEIEELINTGKILPAKEAYEKGWITRVDYIHNILDEYKKNKIKEFKLKIKKSFTGSGKKIALLIFDGGIKDGDNKKDFLMGESIGDRYFIKQIRKIKKDKSIKAVILKVNSPGGSALASDSIAKELEKLKEKKMLVVVQSGVAASGGYYISFPGEKIYTSYTTITGSIGVISLLFYIKDFMENYGITHSILKEGEFSDIYSAYRKREEKDHKIMNFIIETFYQGFISKVAKARNKKIEEIDKIAQGRIWAGADAVTIGIVDDIGDIYKALAYIKEKLKVKKVKIDIYPKMKKSILQKFLSFNPASQLNDFLIPGNFNPIKSEQKVFYYMPEALFIDFKF